MVISETASNSQWSRSIRAKSRAGSGGFAIRRCRNSGSITNSINANASQMSNIGMPMRESLLFVHNALVGAGVRDRIKIGAAGEVVSAFDIAAVLALGADWTNAGRGFMFALRCIQSLSCHTNRCPVGVATQDPLRQRALVVLDKAERVRRFYHNTLWALAE